MHHANTRRSPRFDAWIERDKKLLDPTMPRLNVGITISIKKEETSIFTNGAKQAAFFLMETLKPRHNVVLINLDLGVYDRVLSLSIDDIVSAHVAMIECFVRCTNDPAFIHMQVM